MQDPNPVLPPEQPDGKQPAGPGKGRAPSQRPQGVKKRVGQRVAA